MQATLLHHMHVAEMMGARLVPGARSLSPCCACLLTSTMFSNKRQSATPVSTQ